MDPARLNLEVTALRARAAALRQRRMAAPAQEAALLGPALADLDTALEWLQAAESGLRRQADAVAAADRAARAESERYRHLVESTPDGYVVTDPRGTIVEANRAATELFGSLQQFLVGKPLAVFLAPDEGLAFRFRLLHLAQADRPEEWEVELHPPGRPPFPAQLTVAPARDAAGEPLALCWLVRDITVQQRAEQLVRDAEQQQTASRLEGIALAARALAQLLDPDLGLLVRALALLRQRVDLPDDLRVLAEQAQQALDRTVQRVAQLQQVARVQIRETPNGPALDLERSL